MKRIKINLMVLILIIVLLIGAAIGIGYLLKTKVFDKPINPEIGNTDNVEVNIEYQTNVELKEGEVFFVTDVIKNEENLYTLKGVIYTKYIISEAELGNILEQGKMQVNNVEYKIIKNEGEINLDAVEYCLCETNNEDVRYILEKINSDEYYLKSNATITDCYKLTDKYIQVSVKGDVTVNDEVDRKIKTVEEVFGNYENATPVQQTFPDAKNTFTFKYEDGNVKEVTNVLTNM